MKGFADNIEKLTEENSDFRRVLYTGHNLQLVLMAIEPGDEIGEEVHDDRDQFFRIEGGEGEIWIDGVCNKVGADDGVIVPQGCAPQCDQHRRGASSPLYDLRPSRICRWNSSQDMRGGFTKS